MKNARICFDLDETLCTKKQPHESYSDVVVIEEMAAYLRAMKARGHYIIINTARNMVTQDSNLGKVNKNVGLETLQWLKDNNIPYDEIYFGKPFADFYIDDKAIRPQEINAFTDLGINTVVYIKKYLNNTFKVKKFIKKLFL